MKKELYYSVEKTLACPFISDRQRKLVELRGQGLSLRAAGKLIGNISHPEKSGVDPERARQIEAKAVDTADSYTEKYAEKCRVQMEEYLKSKKV
ncbi:MAG: hypothetical protein WA082_04580 [Candidatus Moraniibacteriota bacterium]